MKAEIISIGTELLLGHIINTNTAFLSQKLAKIGIDVYHTSVVGDNPARLTGSIKQALNRSDIVITTGGLGPTVDDITIETVANFTGKNLVLNKTVLKDLKDYFRIRKVKLPAESIRQALIPEGVKWIRNNVGTAPGLLIDCKGKLIVCLPGPPRELEPMFNKDVLPYLKTHSSRAPLSVPYHGSWLIRSRTIKTTGLAESQVNGMVKDLLALKPPATVGIYAKLGQVDLKITAKAKNDKCARKTILRIENKIRLRLKNSIFGYDDETLEEAVAKVLTKKRLKIAIAESCTGGLVSNRLTNVSGSSEYFVMGAVAYSNKVKENLLGVSKNALDKYGAVSSKVALEMARGVKFLARTDIGVGVTGIAGPTGVPPIGVPPGGGTRQKPVGLVYIALAADRNRVVKEFRFKGSREEIKFQTSQVALDLIRRNI